MIKEALNRPLDIDFLPGNLFGVEPEGVGLKPFLLSGPSGFHRDNCNGNRTGSINTCDWIQEDFILEQYTGLKDKHGKEIYEGDIVTGYYHNLDVDYSKHGAVEWGQTGDSDGWSHRGTTGWVLTNGSSLFDVAYPEWDITTNKDLILCEIIGNIHQNPELISNEKTL